MKHPQYQFQAEKENRETNTLIETLDYYKNRWFWFLLSVGLAIGAATVYLYFAPAQYEVKASVLIKSSDASNDLSEFSAFSDLSIIPGNKNLENETELLKSRKLTAQVVRSLQLNVVFYDPNQRFKNDLFPFAPIKITAQNGDSVFDDKKGNFDIEIINNETVFWKDKQQQFSGNKKLGTAFQSGLGVITLLPTPRFSKTWFGKEIRLEVQPFNEVVDYYQRAINVKPVNDESSVLIISIKHSFPKKAEEIINRLIKVHNEDALSDKNMVAKGTAKFISDRIDYITKELSMVEGEVEAFKSKYHLTDVFTDAGMYAELGSENEKRLLEQSTQLELAQYMLEAVKTKAQSFDLVPTNIGISDQTINNLTLSYNNLVLERNKIVKNSSEKNPVVLNLDAQLASLNSSLIQSLSNQTTMLGFEVRTLKNQDTRLSAKIGEVPRFERTFRDMQRQQQVKESLYLYLLQKREETAIALAVNDSNVKVIDAAYCDGKMVAPNKKIIVLGAVFTGLFIPFLFFYIRLLLDTKVHHKRDLDFLQIPFLCEIPLHNSSDKMVVQRNSNAEIAEAFRLLRSNLSFILSNTSGTSKRIFVTSTISNEGKSVTTLNLAASYALLGKKVLLIGLDLRAPKFTEYMQMSFQKGVTSFIVDESLSWQDLVISVPDFDHFDVISSGPIPPNPAELLTNERVQQLFDEASEIYDFVIVDTAPVGMVSDTLMVASKADVFVYIVRANYLDRRLLEIPEKLMRENRLGSTAIVLNGVDFSKGKGYGYGYGYGYGSAEKKNWFQRTFDKK